ncbi:MAG: MFS transporter, partial [Clostridia bacterium]|nr:MFS transporter [Clostridia bacterium]
MNKLKGKGKLILYACSGLGVNMLNMIVGSYLCSALLTGGFDPDDIGRWTYGENNLVVYGLWMVLASVAKVLDGLIDLPFSHFTDNLVTRFGRRKPALLIGFIPMIIAYLLFLVPLNGSATVLNTIWFAALLCIFYGTYTLTMLTYYATFAEIAETEQDVVLLSNAKSICDVVYMSISFALVPVFVGMGWNIRIVALLFLPLALTMAIPFFMLKEKKYTKEEIVEVKKNIKTVNRPNVFKSIAFTIKDRPYMMWLCVLFVMNIGLQLFLSGINEYFSNTGMIMALVMPPCFAPVPLTIMLYNKVMKKKGLGFAYRMILLIFSAAMALLGLVYLLPDAWVTPFAIFCSLMVSFSIGTFFSITYLLPSSRAALRQHENASASSMYYAIQGLFEAVSAAIGSSVILTLLKETFNGAGVP